MILRAKVFSNIIHIVCYALKIEIGFQILHSVIVNFIMLYHFLKVYPHVFNMCTRYFLALGASYWIVILFKIDKVLLFFTHLNFNFRLTKRTESRFLLSILKLLDHFSLLLRNGFVLTVIF